MGTYSRTILIGHLGRDAELKFTPGGAAVTTFSMATSETWKDKSTGERKEQVEWHRIVLWGKAAEAISPYLLKGKQVAVEGKLQTREWQDDKGVKRYTTEVKADRVVLLGGGNDRRAADAEPESEPRSAAPVATEPDEDVPF
jgi:single-strand DNA-binding protein